MDPRSNSGLGLEGVWTAPQLVGQADTCPIMVLVVWSLQECLANANLEMVSFADSSALPSDPGADCHARSFGHAYAGVYACAYAYSYSYSDSIPWRVSSS